MHPYVNIAVRAARKAGTVILRHLEQVSTLKVYEKGVNDFATAVDKAAEEEIIAIIQKSYPSHAILGEETGEHGSEEGGEAEYTWIIDPLDGTTNYIHGFPQFAVSIGIQHRNQIEHAVIYDPLSQDLYTATRGRGAQLNGKRLRVSKQKNLAGALIGASFPSRNRSKANLERSLDIFRDLFLKSADIRRTGSAALNLAYVAAGRLDGYWEPNLKPWDIAAGALLVREAGGFITDFESGDRYLETGSVIAGGQKVYIELLKIIEKNK